MREYVRPTLAISLAALMFSSPALAYTTLTFSAHAFEGDFLLPPVGIDNRRIDLTGSIDFNSTLSDGSYGIADISSFSLNLELLVHPVNAPPFVILTGDYKFTKADLTSFDITYAGGAPVSAFWTLNPVAHYKTSTPAFDPPPISVDFLSGGDQGLSYYRQDGNVKTLAAKSDINVEISETGAVPEPASWAMMIAGFAMVGASLRKRRMTTALNFG